MVGRTLWGDWGGENRFVEVEAPDEGATKLRSVVIICRIVSFCSRIISCAMLLDDGGTASVGESFSLCFGACGRSNNLVGGRVSRVCLPEAYKIALRNRFNVITFTAYYSCSPYGELAFAQLKMEAVISENETMCVIQIVAFVSRGEFLVCVISCLCAFFGVSELLFFFRT
jgi:hypothetical protein